MVRTVTNAKQAVNEIEILLPCLIIMDISIPDIDGIEFCSLLKSNVVTYEIPIIFISDLDYPNVRNICFKAGAADFISKPFDTEEVIFRIKIHLQMYKVRFELELKNKKLYSVINNQIRKINDNQKEMVNAITNLLSILDISSILHRNNIARNSKLLAMSLQISSKYSNLITDDFIEVIGYAAPLHDIGKIFNKDMDQLINNSKYNSYDTLKTHTLIGASLLLDAYPKKGRNEFLIQAIQIAKHHHEHWDGTGYPDRLSGIYIPLSARIVSVANEFDLLMNSNEDRKCSIDKCIEIMKSKSGSELDPDIVSTFIKIHKQMKY